MPAGIGTSLTRVYTYPAYLTFSYAALPAAVREEADQMQSLWNAMVDVYEVAHRQQERLHKQFLQTRSYNDARSWRHTFNWRSL